MKRFGEQSANVCEYRTELQSNSPQDRGLSNRIGGIMRKIIRKIGIGLASVAAVAGTMTVTAGSASAQSCSNWIEYQYNQGVAVCYGTIRHYRVGAECNSASWPYTINVYGPWQTGGTQSWVFGNNYSCKIAKTWYQLY